MNYNNKTKAELLEIIMQKENEILDLKEDLRQLEKCKKYDDITDEIKAVYDKLVERMFCPTEALEITQTMISCGQIPVKTYLNYRGYQSYR